MGNIRLTVILSIEGCHRGALEPEAFGLKEDGNEAQFVLAASMCSFPWRHGSAVHVIRSRSIRI